MPRLRRAAALALSGLLVSSLVWSLLQESATSDEPVHLADGYRSLVTGDYSLNPEHPPFLKQLAALPLLPLHPRLPEVPHLSGVDPQWEHARRFLFEANRDQAGRLLALGRLPTVLLSLLLALLLHRFADRLFGPPAGLVALALYALEPNLLAHSRYVTTDLGLTFFLAAAVFCFWWCARRPTALRVAALCGASALAAASKYSVVYLPPVLAALVLLRALRAPRGGRAAVFARLAGCALAACGAALLSALFCRGLAFDWEACRAGFVKATASHHPGYLKFLAGRSSVHPFPHYYFAAFALKTPVPLLLALGFGLVQLLRRRLPAGPGLFLLTPPLVIFAFSVAAPYNIGYRHVLPAVPFLVLFAAGALRTLGGRAARAAGAVALGWLLWGWVTIAPHFLSFFNELAGGPARGIEWLDDSNIDWGQALPSLKEWMDRSGVPEVRLLYLGNDDPARFGIRHEPLAIPYELLQASSGVYAMSTHMLRRVGLVLDHELGIRFDWFTRFRPVARPGHAFYVYRFLVLDEGERPPPGFDGQVLDKRPWCEEVEARYHEAMKRNPADLSFPFWLARFRERMGQRERALELLARVAEAARGAGLTHAQAPILPFVYGDLIARNAERGNLEEARRWRSAAQAAGVPPALPPEVEQRLR
jgi:hypothetical protein